jgi:hypothetical protein
VHITFKTRSNTNEETLIKLVQEVGLSNPMLPKKTLALFFSVGLVEIEKFSNTTARNKNSMHLFLLNTSFKCKLKQ